MGHLIKLEWLKMKHYTAFRVLSFLFVVTFPMLLIAGKRIEFSFNQIQTVVDSLFVFPTVFKWLGYAGNWLAFFFLGFMALLSVTNDYNNRTLRQNILTGLSRKEFVLSKVLFIATICGVVTLYYIVLGSLFGYFNTPKIYPSDFTDSLPLFGRFYLMCFGYCMFGLLIGLLVKKTGLSLFIYIAYSLFLERVIRLGFHTQITSNNSMNYYPLKSIEELMPFPLGEKLDAIPGAQLDELPIFISSVEAVIVSSVWIAVFIFVSFFVIKKRDL